eukprot:15476111-Alexandrium_andersonii.AAC.1
MASRRRASVLRWDLPPLVSPGVGGGPSAPAGSAAQPLPARQLGPGGLAPAGRPRGRSPGRAAGFPGIPFSCRDAAP